ncbi:MAG: glycosyltransferase family 2 protein [Anaerolineales bacterium]|nr:glycosyltransferase family 2 protein [Anaerolineales bacterium]
MLPRVAVIVLAYNGVDLTLNCLASLRRSDYANAEVMVVDNASTDNTVEAVRATFPKVCLIEAGDNLGYAGGNNVGLRAALARGADLMFLVNNDTTLERDCISRLVQVVMQRPRLGAIGPMVYTWDEGHLISSAGGVIDWAHADAWNAGAGEEDRGRYPARTVDYVNGCGLMVTRAAVEAAGLLDTRYFMYWEETDWCRRIARAGFELWFEPAARMRHKAPIHHQELGPTTLYYVARNRLLFFARHAPVRLKFLALARALNGLLQGMRRHRAAGRHEYVAAIRWAIWHAVRQQWGRADPALWLISDRTRATVGSAPSPS